METTEKQAQPTVAEWGKMSLNSVARKVKIAVLAETSDVSTVTISKMMNNPKRGYVPKIRKRLLHAAIALAEAEHEVLGEEIQAMKAWVAEEFSTEKPKRRK